MKEQLIISLYIFIPFLVGITFWLVASFQKLKKETQNSLQPLFLELASERNLATKLKKNKLTITALENKTNLQFRKINLEIANIDFSFKEIF